MVSDREIYFFDLNGFLVLRGALSKQEVTDINASIDALLPFSPASGRAMYMAITSATTTD